MRHGSVFYMQHITWVFVNFCDWLYYIYIYKSYVYIYSLIERMQEIQKKAEVSVWWKQVSTVNARMWNTFF